MLGKDREAKQVNIEGVSRSRVDDEARALARIYGRAIERSKQKQLATEVCDDENRSEAGYAGGPP